MEEELIWTTFDGRKIKLSEIEHQHLSNILWFNEVFNLRNRYNNQVHFELGLELERRFKGVRLPWKPLPIPDEIDLLKKMGLIRDNGDIIGNKGTLSKEGAVIGNINHIK